MFPKRVENSINRTIADETNEFFVSDIDIGVDGVVITCNYFTRFVGVCFLRMADFFYSIAYW